MLTKYVVYKFEEMLSENSKANFDRLAATIEHIIPISSCANESKFLNIGNLILLEKVLNQECDIKNFKDKYQIYKKSNYCTTKYFLNRYDGSNEFSVDERAEEIASKIYEMITVKWK